MLPPCQDPCGELSEAGRSAGSPRRIVYKPPGFADSLLCSQLSSVATCREDFLKRSQCPKVGGHLAQGEEPRPQLTAKPRLEKAH